MADPKFSSQSESVVNDLGPLAWVLGEVRTSLEASSKALKRFARDAAHTRGKDMASIDSSQLRLAKQQLRQVVGALEMVDLEKPALVLKAMESTVERFVQSPELCSDAAADTLEKAGFALTAYLEGMLAGRSVSAVALFPQYAEVQQLAGNARIHPVDLWEVKWRWAAIVAPSAPALELDAAVKAQMDAPVLQVMRSFDTHAAQTLKTLSAGLSLDGKASAHQQTLWRLASAFFEAIEQKLLAADLYTKRTITSVLLQANEQTKDPQAINTRLAQELLFFSAHAHEHPESARALNAVLGAYGLTAYKCLDYSKRVFGHYDPAMLAQARKRIAAVKETWSLVTAGESNKYQLIKDQIQAISESIAKLFPAGADLANALNATADHIVKRGQPPETNVAMEVATSLLYAEAVLEDADLSNPELEARTQRLAERIAHAQQGGAAHPLDSWMEELYRNVSDRQNMGSVVGELKVSLGELEKLMDQFFRKPEDLAPLQQVPDKLRQMRGVMSILGLDDAIKAVQWMRDHIERVATQSLSQEEAQTSGIFEKIGTNLGALGFLIDMLSYQPVLAKKLFIYDNEAKELKPLMGRAASAPNASATAADADATVDIAGPSAAAGENRDTAAAPLEQTVSTTPLTNASQTLFDATTKLPTYHADTQEAAPIHLAAPEESSFASTITFPSAAATESALDFSSDTPSDEHAIADASAAHAEHVQADEAFAFDLSETPSEAVAAHASPTTPPASAAAPASTPPPSPAAIATQSPLEDVDDELLEIFLEEAKEVTVQGLAAIENLRADPKEVGELTTLRRSFHTLKGSSRMVGLNKFGESAWAMEQVLNAWLADSKPASEAMLDLSHQAMSIFADWVHRLATEKSDGPYHPEPFQHSSELMRSEQQFQPLEFAAAAESPSAPVTPAAVAEPEISHLGDDHAADFTSAAFDASTVVIEAPHMPEDAHHSAATEESSAPIKLPSLDDVLLHQAAANEAPAAEAFFAENLEAPAAPGEPAAAGIASSNEEALAFFDLETPEASPTHSHADSSEEPPPHANTAVVAPEEDEYKVIGDLRISLPLYNIFLAEADDWSRRLIAELADWSLDHANPIANSTVALAHSLAGTAGTVGYADLSAFARSLEHCLARDRHAGTEESAHRFAPVYVAAAEEIRHLLHQFAAGILLAPQEEIQHRLHAALNEEVASADIPSARLHIEDLLMQEHEGQSDAQGESQHAAASEALEHFVDAAHPTGAEDHLDEHLFPIFEEEANELLPELSSHLRQWQAAPEDMNARSAVLRVLHTLKGSARLAGAMQLGDKVHHMESSIEMLGAEGVPAAELDALLATSDEMAQMFDDLCHRVKHPSESAHFAPHAAQAVHAVSSAEQAPALAPLEAEAFEAEAFEAEACTFAPDESPAPEPTSPALTIPASEASALSLTESLAENSVATHTPAPSPAVAQAAASERKETARHLNDDLDSEDSIDENLFPIFEDEAKELLPELNSNLQQWHNNPENTQARAAILRVLHTLKGSARLAGAMRLGEMAHHMESAIEMLGAEQVPAAEITNLLESNDDLTYAFEALCHQVKTYELNATQPAPLTDNTLSSGAGDASSVQVADFGAEVAQQHLDQSLAALTETAALTVEPEAPLPLSQHPSQHIEASETAGSEILEQASEEHPPLPARQAYVLRSNEAASQTVRVRSHLLDLLVNLAGEVMITRAKLENELSVQLRSAVTDLTGNLERLRQQLRDIEVQAESQMQSRLALSKETSQTFDPLEFDRFTRTQELTRMMAESVNDVATVQRNVQGVLDATEGALIAQARQTRELQRYLLRTRMVEFDSISDRLYRVIRQAAKDTGKQVRMDIVGASIELDRGVLERMTPAFEHLLRNCLAHGIESAGEREAAGKEAAGLITIHIAQEGNDVAIEFKDDGAGLNVARILEIAEKKGIITQDSKLSDQEIFNLIFAPGFSTATEVSTLAGRGVGMDVVKNEVQALGGRIETNSVRYKGTSFKLVLPLTTAVTQVVMVRAGHISFGVPANLLEVVRRLNPKELEQAYADQGLSYLGETIPFQWAGALLQASPASTEPVGRSTPVIIIRSASQRVAVHVDEVLGNQEVVVKNLGPQLSHLPGLAGMSLLASGAIVLIYNPVALYTVYRERAAEFIQQAKLQSQQTQQVGESHIPLVMVVDDSITVRRVTQRLLQREGYRVLLANDGLMALEKLAEGELPSVILSDIEMPRMDGFDLARNIRADARIKHLPIVMITSRMAEKHREHAMSLGANHYLGKPYAEDELLAIIRDYTKVEAAEL